MSTATAPVSVPLAVSGSYIQVAIDFSRLVVSGEKVAGKEWVQGCQRFLDDLTHPEFELHEKEPRFVIEIIRRTMVHRQGEDMEGNSLVGKPLVLEPWQIFIVVNLVGFYYRGTQERRFKEAFIMVPRKNGKTTFVAALAWGLAMLERRSGSSLYLVAASRKQAEQSFKFICHSLRAKGIAGDFKIRDNNAETSIHGIFPEADGHESSLHIEALASNPDTQDSFNCNLAIVDELHALKRASQYNRFKEAMAAYTNKLIIGITTAGDEINSFCYRRLEYAAKVVSGTVQDDDLFVFICRADQDDRGNVDFLDPIQHEKANPNWGVTIRPADILGKALQAQNDPQQRKDFLSRCLNVYTSAMLAYFDLAEFKASDRAYTWTLEELGKLPVRWYGGTDLSKMHDLTAACLYGQYQGVDICITHAFFPRVAAHRKADEDNIPLFGWEEDGWLTMSNTPTVNYEDVVAWYIKMRAMGFKVKLVGHDRKFGREYIAAMHKAGFKVADQPQYHHVKSEGFRHIEKAVKDGKFYYLHSEAYEYCVENVQAIELTDDMIKYSKTRKTNRIDLFDASVFACVAMLSGEDKAKAASGWFD